MERNMNRLATLVLFCAFFLPFALDSCIAASGGEVEDESEFNYDMESERGPPRWGEIKEEWSTCGNGMMQSPIDLSDEHVDVVPLSGRPNWSYERANAILMNRGHDIMVKWEGGAGSIQLNGKNYTLLQCHWHSPSEHTLNGRKYDLELHMVHQSLGGEIAVIGILYECGRPDPFLSSLMDDIAALAYTHEVERDVGMVNPNKIKIGCPKYYRYMGSLTTPPCTENVTWTIVQKVRTVSEEQVRLLREAVHEYAESNARPLQAINGRPVELHIPTDCKPESQHSLFHHQSLDNNRMQSI